MDQPNTTTVTETQLELAQVPRVAEESHTPICQICLESLDDFDRHSCDGCHTRFHWLCIKEWLVNDPNLVELPSATQRYNWDFKKSRCPNCRMEQPCPIIAIDLNHSLQNLNEVLNGFYQRFLEYVQRDIVEKGENIARQLFCEGKSFNDVRSKSHFNRIVNRILKKREDNLAEFINSSLKHRLRKIIVTDFVTECSGDIMKNCRSRKQKYIRAMMYTVKENLFILLFEYKLSEYQEKSIECINHQMKTFVLENLVGQEFPLENNDVFDEIARCAHAQYHADHTNYYSNLRIACADCLIPEQMAALATHHLGITSRDVLLPNIRQQVSNCYALNKMKFETSGKDAWTSHASEVLANAAGAPPSDLWVFSADEYSSSRVRTRSQGPLQLSDVPPSDSLVVPAAEPPPKRMRTRSQGPPDP